MKKEFFDFLEQLLKQNKDVYFLYGDLGYPRAPELQAEYPDRVINCGASEQTMMDMAVGLSYAGKIPITYTITPFYLRAWETIRTFIDREHLFVVMIGVGQNDDYKHDGFSHDATDTYDHWNLMKNIKNHHPQTAIAMIDDLETALVGTNLINRLPYFINIKR